ncbi:MAG: NAD(P)/FAD-dependent oxidoreductase [Lachnospirales bacterium]
MLKIINLKVAYNSEIESVKYKLAKTLKVNVLDIQNLIIIKKSLDKRQKGNYLDVYTLTFSLINNVESDFISKNVSLYNESTFEVSKAKKQGEKVAVVGFGPCGIFASLSLLKAGLVPVVFERGEEVEKRLEKIEILRKNGELDCDSNIQFGEGGAGTFSDGKLTTNVKDERITYIIDEFIGYGANKEIKIKKKPHIGTDVLRNVVKNIRLDIIQKGGIINFSSKVIDFEKKDDGIVLSIKKNNEIIKEEYKAVIFATGHSARDVFFTMHKNGVKMESKPFSFGFRIEHKQEFIDRYQYQENYDIMDKNDIIPCEYKISTHLENGRGVYTFCMCPGGEVVPSMSEEGTVVTNGMSSYARNLENSNAAILVSVNNEDFLKFKNEDTPNELAGIDFQRHFETLSFQIGGKNYFAPCQLTSDFLINKKSEKFQEVMPTYKPGTTFVDFNEYLPEDLSKSLKDGIKELDKKLRGFGSKGSILTGFETRSSSPVKIYRDDFMFTNIEGIIFAGEGSGYSGGITTSALEGIKACESVVAYYNKLQS